jgi:hypothetical protein
MKQISLDYFKALVDQILRMAYLNDDLVDALGYKYNAQRLTGEEWGAIILQVTANGREGLLSTLLQMDSIIAPVPVELLEGILTKFLDNSVPSAQVVHSIVKGPVIKKMSFDFSTRFLKELINKLNSNGAELMLRDEKYINSLPEEYFRVIAQALVRRRLMWTSSLLDAVLSKHIVSRMLESEIGPILIKLHLTEMHQMSLEILEKAHDKVSGPAGARILKDVSESPYSDYPLLSALVEVKTITGEHWLEALELFYDKKDSSSIDIILSQQHIIQALEPDVRVGLLDTLTRDEAFSEGLSPVILEEAKKSRLDYILKTDGLKPVPQFPRRRTQLDVQNRLPSRAPARSLIRLPPVRRILRAAAPLQNLRALRM